MKTVVSGVEVEGKGNLGEKGEEGETSQPPRHSWVGT